MISDQYYRVTKSSVIKNKPGGEVFDVEESNEGFKDMKEAVEWFKNNYGTIPTKKWRKVYVDIDGNPEQVGWLKAYWNSNLCHDVKNFWQEDWITLLHIKETVILDLRRYEE